MKRCARRTRGNLMRQIVLDTETTGLSPEEGHRIIEIGCVELIDRKLTGNRFHVYINPQREVDAGAVNVHGLDNQFLADKPVFEQIAADFFAFVEGAELIIHNAPFDVGFINAELRRLEVEWLPGDKRSIDHYCEILDTLSEARKKHPGQRNTLDALCKRYNVNNSHRDLHGALLDAEILAEVYLAMTGGQSELLLDAQTHGEESDQGDHPHILTYVRQDRPKLPVIPCTEAELEAHEARLADVARSSGGRCLWKR